jgi:hypothetical protein
MLTFETNGFIIFDLSVINKKAVRIAVGQNTFTHGGFNNIVK